MDKISICFADETFTTKNLYKALNTVVRWYTLGTHLGIPLDQLEQIKQERFGNNLCQPEV